MNERVGDRRCVICWRMSFNVKCAWVWCEWVLLYRIWSQFHETNLSVNSSQAERNSSSTLKTRGDLMLSFAKISAGRNFTLNFYLTKLTSCVKPSLNFLWRLRVYQLKLWLYVRLVSEGPLRWCHAVTKTVGNYGRWHGNYPGVLRSENCARPGLAVVPLADGGASDGVGAAAARQLPASDEAPKAF